MVEHGPASPSCPRVNAQPLAGTPTCKAGPVPRALTVRLTMHDPASTARGCLTRHHDPRPAACWIGVLGGCTSLLARHTRAVRGCIGTNGERSDRDRVMYRLTRRLDLCCSRPLVVRPDGVSVRSDAVPVCSDAVFGRLKGVPVRWDGVPVRSNGVPVRSDDVPAHSARGLVPTGC